MEYAHSPSSCTFASFIISAVTKIFGRAAASNDSYKYSKDFQTVASKGLVWNAETIAGFVADPKGYLGDIIGKDKANTRIAFGGISKEEDVRDLIAYLKQATAQ